MATYIFFCEFLQEQNLVFDRDLAKPYVFFAAGNLRVRPFRVSHVMRGCSNVPSSDPHGFILTPRVPDTIVGAAVIPQLKISKNPSEGFDDVKANIAKPRRCRGRRELFFSTFAFVFVAIRYKIRGQGRTLYENVRSYSNFLFKSFSL